MATCLIVQHLEPEKPFAIASALVRRGVDIDLRLVYAGDPIPGSADGYSAVVVMGGPMSARSDEGFPTGRTEIALLADALARQVPTLGVCLGAQLLAAAAGALVVVGDEGPEIGWGEISVTDLAVDDRLFAGMPSTLTVLHWHGETFELPASAVHLASSAAYPNQAFRVGPCAWGLQFHLEVDEPATAAFVSAFADEARAAGVDPEDIHAATPEALGGLTDHRDGLLDRFAQLCSVSAVNVESEGAALP
ncbi:MAG: type 1 glutamine amidotransferase [Acidimicrobiales bacterium]